MPSEPSDGIFDALAVYGRGAGAGKYPYRHCRYTVTLKPAIPAQAGIRICRDSLKSGGGGMVLQINDVDTNSGEFAIYTAQDASVKLDLLKMELKHCKEMLEQKTKKSSCSAS
ncbi:hypothetical protein MYC81_002214 [Neisseria gonorrhoeae]|uniref:Uncharacterized protein n=1 Tax=Neisseria gonorrhoeae (strain ATCC 700825 / FA 1090) TaxID=242231 RepID=Q5F5Q5_NEIG1|nr:hypothetical protein NGO_1861 [Neisseria gonorrhoeae FA 1090]AKP15101.1 hypothetical protein WX61_01043 [Neisseria gonorrhoeae]EEZ42561.1 conserved hypothetical protein [Neisseria gonorrhoeae 35/02]EFF40559.1 hypothetical protein NGNG_01783 [Neisseria gonorrhoeae F62]KAE9495042.1 hypothetical protein F9Z35_1991 [Neisseria gonorrhoeae]